MNHLYQPELFPLRQDRPRALTSYICDAALDSNLERFIVNDMTERMFPCVASRTLDTMENRIITLKDSRLAFLFFFTANPTPLAWFELGLTIQTGTTIVFLGPTKTNFTAKLEDKKIIHCLDYENFTALRFP